MRLTRSYFNKILIAAIAVSLAYAGIAQAQGAGASSPTTVPINTGQDFQSIEDYMKSFTLDKVATQIAKQMLQQVTASIVSWINSGFQGSPSFLTNPEGYFADAADQITGSFIAGNGALSSLCSPFNLDIRLALGLSQSQQYRRYRCTLNTIIGNAKNGPLVNGKPIKGTMQGFLSGDFRQGGWPAFISLNESSNNVYGAYLTAQSDILSRIASDQSKKTNDLLQGRGFRSFETCDDVSGSMYSNKDGGDYSNSVALNAQQANQLSQPGNQTIQTYGGTSLRKTQDANGNIKYQNCTTQTPGSVIQGTLQKSLDIPLDSLNLADSINSVVSALFTQLVTKAMSKGLYSSTAHPSASSKTGGIVWQLQHQSDTQALGTTPRDLSRAITQYAGAANQYLKIKQTALDLVQNVQTAYDNASGCFAALASSTPPNAVYASSQATFAQNQLAYISLTVSTKILPLESTYSSQIASANGLLTDIQAISDDAKAATSTQALQAIMNTYLELLRQGDTSSLGSDSSSSAFNLSQNDMAAAQDDLKQLRKDMATYTTDAKKYLTQCHAYRPTNGATGNGMGNGSGNAGGPNH